MSRARSVLRSLVGVSLAIVGTAAAAQAFAKKPLTLERASDPALVMRGASEIAWRDANRVTFLSRESGDERFPATLREFDVRTGHTSSLVAKIPAQENGKDVTIPLRGYSWSPKGDALLLTGQHDLWIVGVTASKAGDSSLDIRRLTHDAEDEEDATFSPDGRRVAFVRKNDLFVIEVATGRETRLTTAGAGHVLNGKLDWVYQEELANRCSRSYEWAPDSSAIAYLRLDETHVPEFPIVDFTPVNGKLLPQRYPKAGDPNPAASVHIVDLAGNQTASFALEEDGYIAPGLSWTADGKDACLLTLNRAQTELTAHLLSRSGGSRVLFTEKDPAWINSIEPPRFLKDGGFVFLSERTGYVHLYRYGKDGTPKNAVTKGDWMIDRTFEVDEKSGVVYFVATEKDPRQRHLYRVRLDGSGFTRLSQGRGVHTFKLSPDGTFFTDTFSDLDTPPKTVVHRSDSSLVTIADDSAPIYADLALGTTELGSFRASDGTLLYTRLVRPADFDPKKKYPAVVYVYGGPHVQVVEDRWGGTSLFDHLMAQKGILVWSVDNRGSWGRGHAFETPLLKRMGETELKDQLAGIDRLKALRFVDGKRLGIWGWSYGGYLTLYAATHAGSAFVCAAAGAPVTDWKFYDSIYTERYMKLPKENPEGYRAASPLEAAKNLGTRLLILHGTSDENVHMQNSIEFVDELMKARKDFVYVPLPRQKHGPRREALLYRNQRILEWFEENLRP
jgi:dipeptidyl-peptidase-4